MAKHRAQDLDLDDQPTQEPMRGIAPAGIRRAPSSDQKRYRRQQARSQEQSMQSNNPKTADRDTSMSPRREADLLAAMASAGDSATQRRLGAELETMRANRIAAQRQAASLDLSALSHIDRWEHNPNPASIRTSMASDWIMDVPVPEHTAEQRDREMIAEASLWFTQVSEAVKTDPEEFDIQAVGAAEYAASEFGEDSPAALQTFLAHLSSLAGRKVAEDISTIPVGTTQTGPPATTEPMDTIEAPADTGPAEVDHSGPSDNPSLSEGNSPAGDEGGEPVSQSATENNAGDSGDPAPTIDNSPANPTVLPPASRGAKRQALMESLAKSVKCRACGEAIHRDEKGNWKHSEYLYQRGHQRNHVAAPEGHQGAKTKTAETGPQVDSNAATGQPAAQNANYQIGMKHPSGATFNGTVVAGSPEHALQLGRSMFKNEDEAGKADWTVKRVQAKTAAAPEPNGLNSGVDFQPVTDPADSMSLGPDEEGDWPPPADGNPQTMSNPETPRGATAALFDAATDQRIAVATIDHELASTAAADGTIHVDGDLMVIAAEIADEPYVVAPVRRVYVGIDEYSEAPSTSDDFNTYGNPGAVVQPPYEDQYAPGEVDYSQANDEAAQDMQAHPDWYGEPNQNPEYDGMLGDDTSVL